MKKIESVVIMPNVLRDKDYKVTKDVASLLLSCKVKVFLQSQNNDANIAGAEYFDDSTFPVCDALVVIGGDGSVLDAGKYAIEYGICIIAVNKGHLGYLTELDEDEIHLLTDIVNGEYGIDERLLLEAEYNGKVMPLAMNDYVLTHKSQGAMIEYEISDGGNSSIYYSSDSLVIASPSGSTGYSMSGGGPVLDSSIEAICVTPIAPHSFFNRSIVFGSDTTVCVKNVSDREKVISVMADGRVLVDLHPFESIKVSAAKKRIKFIVKEGSGTLDKLCRKMKMNNAKYTKERK